MTLAFRLMLAANLRGQWRPRFWVPYYDGTVKVGWVLRGGPMRLYHFTDETYRQYAEFFSNWI